MSARIVVNLTDGLAQSAVDRTPDGGTWLSLWQGREVVIVKLTMPGLQGLHEALGRELASAAAGESSPIAAAEEGPIGAPKALAMRPRLPISGELAEPFNEGRA